MTPETPAELDHRVATFAADWLRLGEPGVGDDLVADPILVLGPGGTVPVPRAAFLAAVAGRADAVGPGAAAATTLGDTAVVALGDRMALATISWAFGDGADGDADAVTLVSDFLLQREGDGRLRCVAYLPRTNVLDHLE